LPTVSGRAGGGTVIVLRFFQDLDQSAIAARIGYPQMQVSRLLRRALAACAPSSWSPERLEQPDRA
jgi:hypothetical protein